jgi:hypothetical protein
LWRRWSKKEEEEEKTVVEGMKKRKLATQKEKVIFSFLSFSFFCPLNLSAGTMGRGLSQRRRVANVLKARQVRERRKCSRIGRAILLART